MYTVLKKIFIFICIIIFIYISVFLMFFVWSEYKGKKEQSCDIESGCLNKTLLKQVEGCTTLTPCKNYLYSLTERDFNQIIFLRKGHYDLSKTCGDLQISYTERLLFNEDYCDYLVFSKDVNMVGYIRGNCFSATETSKVGNNFRFFNKKKTKMINRVLDKNLEIKNDNQTIEVQINPDVEITKLDCFTQFSHQGI